MTKTVVVTGSSGYIGGQTALQLNDLGYTVIGVDIRPCPANVLSALSQSYQGDFASQGAIDFMFAQRPSAIIHCAGTSLVGPSINDPELYYQNNFVRTKKMIDAVVAAKLQSDIRIIFSSSASVYGEPIMGACQEEDPALPLSPYGESKLMTEMMLQSYFRAYGLQPVIFRYFNACGADSQARHGQEPSATHIIARVLESLRDDKEFVLNGNRYNTVDGTCVRDYVHVEDIARAHIRALDDDIPTGVYNLGSNNGTSNREIISIAESITGRKLKVVIGDPRPGDPAELTANAGRFEKTAGKWQLNTLNDIVQHAWNWYVR